MIHTDYFLNGKYDFKNLCYFQILPSTTITVKRWILFYITRHKVETVDKYYKIAQKTLFRILICTRINDLV